VRRPRAAVDDGCADSLVLQTVQFCLDFLYRRQARLGSFSTIVVSHSATPDGRFRLRSAYSTTTLSLDRHGKCDLPWSRRISGRKTLKSRIAFMASSDEDNRIKSREFMIFFPEYPGNLHGSQIGTKIVS